MKLLLSIFILLSFISYKSEAQDINLEQNENKVVLNDKIISNFFDKLPNAFLTHVHSSNKVHHWVNLNYRNKRYSKFDINMFFLDLKLYDSIILSDDDIIKTFLFMVVCESMPDTVKYNTINKLEIQPIDEIYENRDLQAKWTNFKLNYKATVEWSGAVDRVFGNVFRFNIQEQEMISITIITDIGFEEFVCLNYSDEKEKILPTGKDYYKRNFKKSRSNESSLELEGIKQ